MSASGRLLIAVMVSLALAGGAAAAGSEHLNTATYTAFDALTANIRRVDGRRGVLTVQGGLDVKDPALRARATLSTPLLRDAYVRALSLYAASLAPGSPPDIDQIALRLQRATDDVLGRPGARLLVGTVMVN